MSKNIIRMFCLVVTAAMMITMIACSQSSETPQDTTGVTTATTTQASGTSAATTTAATTTQPVEVNPFAEFYEITWLTGISDDKYIEGGFDELMLEEKYNVDFKIWNISNYDPEGLAMMLAAGDIPDIGYLPHAPLDAVQLYNDGFTRLVPLDMYKTYFPYYYEQMLKNAPSSFVYNNKRNEDGSLSDDFYGISFIMSVYKTYYNVPLMRLDWLENVGYTIPESDLTPIKLTDEKLGQFSDQLFVSNHIFPHDVMNDIFRAFTEDDPDGNGEDDTYGGVIFDHSFRSHWTDLYWGQFGVISSEANFLYKDSATGDVVPWYAYEGYRDYMAWAVDMREKGYLRTLPEGHQSLAPQGSWYDNLLANWMTGKIGYFFADRQYLCRPDFPEYSDRQPPQSIWLNSGDKEATFVSFPALAGPGPEGSWGTRRYALDAFAEGKFRTYTIAAEVSDGKLARMLTIWNDRYTDAESDFWIKVLYGVEGVHYKWTGEAWKSGMIATAPEKIPAHYRRYGGFGGSFSAEISPVMNEAMTQYMKFFLDNNWTQKYTLEPHKYLSVMYMGSEMRDAYTADWNAMSADINAIIADFRNRSWGGQISNVSTEWAQYINQLYAAGLEKLVTDYFNNPAFETYTRPDLS